MTPSFRVLGVSLPDPNDPRAGRALALITLEYGALIIAGAALVPGNDGALRIALPSRNALQRIVLTRAARAELTARCIEAARLILPALPAAAPPVARAPHATEPPG